MCGRFWLRKKGIGLEQFGDENDFKESYNIAPGHWVDVIVWQEGITIKEMRWGLIPSWARQVNSGYQMINARAETLDEKKTYKKLLKDHRCLIPCSGFYEWQQVGRQKTPYCIKRKDNAKFALAGLWTSWQSPTTQEIKSFTIITTNANEIIRSIHDRMPVIIPESQYLKWLQSQDDESVKSLLYPQDADMLVTYAISTYVNTPENNDEQCIQPV